MEPKIMFAVESGIQSFLQSTDCSQEVRERIELDQAQGQFSGQHFHDLAIVIVATLSAFIAGVAANIASAYFEKKLLSNRDAEKVAEDAAKARKNEIRLRLGEKAIEELWISETEIKLLGRHIHSACEKVKE